MLDIEKLTRRIFDISFKYHLCHLSSCISSLPILIEIYNKKKENEPFILSQGHAGICLYVILEAIYGLNAEELFKKHGIHPNRDIENKIYCSTGSLGVGLNLALGIALVNKNNVFCTISDGECFEENVWSSLRIKTENNIDNLKLFVNINGNSGYRKVNKEDLIKKLLSFDPKIHIRDTEDFQNSFSFLRGVQGHYYYLKEIDINA